MLQLTNKERTLLQDLQSHEEICIQKYNNYANQAKDPQLKQIFQNLAQKEQNHYNTISQILQGQVPNMAAGGQQGQTTTMYSNQNNPMANSMGSEKEESLCNDMLMTEKYVSSAYNTSIFEMTNSQVRQALQHIQQEEQQHGEELFNYMRSHGMYNING